MFRCFLRSCAFRIAPCARAAASSAGGAAVLRDVEALEMIGTPPGYVSAVVSVPPATQTDPSAVIKARDDFRDLMAKIDDLTRKMTAQGAAQQQEMRAQGTKIDELTSRMASQEKTITAQGKTITAQTSRMASQEKKIKRLDNNFKHAFEQRFPSSAHERSLVLLLYDCALLTENTALQARHCNQRHGIAHSLPKKRAEAIKQLGSHISGLQLSSTDVHRRLVADATAMQDALRGMGDDYYHKKWLALRSSRKSRK